MMLWLMRLMCLVAVCLVAVCLVVGHEVPACWAEVCEQVVETLVASAWS